MSRPCGKRVRPRSSRYSAGAITAAPSASFRTPGGRSAAGGWRMWCGRWPALVEQGTTEVTLLGQTVNSYHDGAHDFADLLRAVGAVDGIRRVRFTSPYPTDFTPRVIEAMATTPAVCEHVHLPVQSGSNAVLKRMLRRYTPGAVSRGRGRAARGHARHHVLDRHHRRVPRRDRGGIRGDAQPGHRCRLRRRLHLQVLAARGHARRCGCSDHVPDEVASERLERAHRGGARQRAPQEYRAGRRDARGAGRAPGQARAISCWPAPVPTSSSWWICPQQPVGEYHRVRLTGTTGSTFTGAVVDPGPGGLVIRNLVEDHVVAAYDTLRPHFPEFCGCEICREDVLVYALNRVPPRYVATPTGLGRDRGEPGEGPEPRAIEVTMMEALRKVSLAPRCANRARRTRADLSREAAVTPRPADPVHRRATGPVSRPACCVSGRRLRRARGHRPAVSLAAAICSAWPGALLAGRAQRRAGGRARSGSGAPRACRRSQLRVRAANGRAGRLDWGRVTVAPLGRLPGRGGARWPRGRPMPAGPVAASRRDGSRGPGRPGGRPGCWWSATSGSAEMHPGSGRPTPDLPLSPRVGGCMALGRGSVDALMLGRRGGIDPSCRTVRPVGAGPPALDLRLPRRADHRLGLPSLPARPDGRARARWSSPRRSSSRLRRLPGLAGAGGPGRGARRRPGALPGPPAARRRPNALLVGHLPRGAVGRSLGRPRSGRLAVGRGALGRDHRSRRWSDRALGPGFWWRTLGSSVGATLATAPITAGCLGAVALVGIVLNFAAIPHRRRGRPGVLASLLLLPVWPRRWRGRWRPEPGSALHLLEVCAAAGAASRAAHCDRGRAAGGHLPGSLRSLWPLGQGSRNTLREAGRRSGGPAWSSGLRLFSVLAPRGDGGGGLALHFLDVGRATAACSGRPVDVGW